MSEAKIRCGEIRSSEIIRLAFLDEIHPDFQAQIIISSIPLLHGIARLRSQHGECLGKIRAAALRPVVLEKTRPINSDNFQAGLGREFLPLDDVFSNLALVCVESFS